MCVCAPPSDHQLFSNIISNPMLAGLGDRPSTEAISSKVWCSGAPGCCASGVVPAGGSRGEINRKSTVHIGCVLLNAIMRA